MEGNGKQLAGQVTGGYEILPYGVPERFWRIAGHTSLSGAEADGGIPGVIEGFGLQGSLSVSHSLSRGTRGPDSLRRRTAVSGNCAGGGGGGAPTQEKSADRPPWKGQHEPRRGAGKEHRKNNDA